MKQAGLTSLRQRLRRSAEALRAKAEDPALINTSERRCFVTRTSLDSRWRDPEQPERGGRDRFHVAINMDGNGRWALLRGRPREEGHVAGAAAVRRTVESAPALGITTLTLYAFSSDNWRRPRGEVDNLMFLFQKYLDSECDRLTDSGVRFNVIGRRDRIPDSLRRSIAHVEERTQRRHVSPPPGCDRLFGPRGAVGGGRPCRQGNAPDARGVRAIHVRGHPRAERHA